MLKSRGPPHVAVNGVEAVEAARAALDAAQSGPCDAYLQKPIRRAKLQEELRKLSPIA